jgi:ribonuclease T1
VNTKFLKIWCFFLAAMLLSLQVFARGELSQINSVSLPVEAQQVLKLIRQGGPFPYEKDGIVFGNYEGILPKQKRGYYHEYTVTTPGQRNRGARRIVAGGEPAVSHEYYYTDDHYATFRRIQE